MPIELRVRAILAISFIMGTSCLSHSPRWQARTAGPVLRSVSAEQQPSPRGPSSSRPGTASKPAPASVPSPSRDGRILFHNTVVREGIALELQIEPLSGADYAGASIIAGDYIRISIGVHDAETGSPLTGLHPSAWMSLLGDSADVPCKVRVKSYLSGSLLAARPEVDLNTYYVAALNQSGSITVVDPQFSSGRSRLVSRIELKGPGEDWSLSSDRSRLYVSMPTANQVAAIDTGSWHIVRRTQIQKPARLALQPDEQYLWVSYGDQPSGIAVLRASDLGLVKQIALAKGPHDIAFSSDSRFALVTNRGAGSVAVIETSRLAVIRELKTGGQPSHVAFSAIAQSAYVTDSENGMIFSISAAHQEVVPRMQAEPGLTHIYFPGDGRLGFVLNPRQGKVHILDVARNEIVQTAAIDKMPAQIAFSDQLAYVVRQGSELIEMFPLDQLGGLHTRVPVVDLPGAKSSGASYFADDDSTALVVQIPGENSVVIASPGDKAMYYYDEGMAAPMGISSNFGEEPRAVLVIDRSLRERTPGIYETSTQLDKPGVYSLPLLVNSPPLVECFTVPVAPRTTPKR